MIFLIQKHLKRFELNRNSLTTRTLIAAGWSVIGRGFDSIIRLSSNLILTRLLYPEAFGLIATASIVLTMVQLFSDTGVKTALIQNPRGDQEKYLNTSWLISIVRGILLFTLVFGLTKPLALFYNQPQLEGLLIMMAFSLLISGFNNPALPIVIKKLNLKKQVIYEVGTQFLGFICTIYLAYILQSVWAMAIGYLMTSIFRLLGSYMVLPFLPKIMWNKKAGSELFHFGKYIFLNTLITWAALNSDKLLLGKILDMKNLGFYQIGLGIGLLVEQVVINILSQSYFPAVSSIAKDFNKVKTFYEKTITIMLMVTVPSLMVIALFSEEIINFLYEPRYKIAAIALYWISLRGLFRCVSIIQGNTLIALGKPVYQTIPMLIGLIAVLVFIPIGASISGLYGACIGIFGAGIIVSFMEALFLFRFWHFPLQLIFKPWLKMIIVCFVIIIAHQSIGHLFSGLYYFKLPLLSFMLIFSFTTSVFIYFPNIKHLKKFPAIANMLNKYTFF